MREFRCGFGRIYLYLFLDSPHIDAEVVRWVYTVGSEKPSATSKTGCPESVTNQQVDSFRHSSDWVGSVLDAAKDANTSTVTPQGIDQPFGGKCIKPWSDYLAANVDVTARQEMTAELLRSTKKNPPEPTTFMN